MSYNPYNQGPGAEAGYGYGQQVSVSPGRAGCSRIETIVSIRREHAATPPNRDRT
jgi:hypothetical protein